MSQILMRSDLEKILPCRENFIMLDRVCMESETKIVGYKAVSLGEWYFMGHFPNHPIMPGVLQVEAMNQLAELLAWKKLDPERKGDIYLKSLKKVKFRRPNNPGDRIRFTVEITGGTSDTVEFTALAENNGGASCQALLTLSVRPKEPACVPADFNAYDKSDSIALDVTKISSFIPHRYPFLLVDYVSRIEDSRAVAIKNACSDEMSFRKYADGYQVMSGSVHPEIVAQSGCISVLAREENKGKIAYFMSIDEAEYFHPVRPGDQLVCDIEIPNGKSKFGKGKGVMMVNGEVVTSCGIMFALIDP